VTATHNPLKIYKMSPILWLALPTSSTTNINLATPFTFVWATSPAAATPTVTQNPHSDICMYIATPEQAHPF